jgi:hypothetical protein
MGRWKQQDATVCIFGTVNCAFGENTSDARRIVNTHNADCDAYEARIAELKTMLASEVADNAHLRAREVGDEVGNVLQELAEANNRIAELEADKQIKISVLVDNEAPFFGAFWSEERDGCFGIIVNLKNCAGLGESEEQFNQVVQDTLAHELIHAIQAAYGQMFSETQVREALEDPAKLECAEDTEQMIQQIMNDFMEVQDNLIQAKEERDAELRAELARVKAESLRVVEDPDSDEWVMTPDGLGWYGQDAIGNPKIETPHAYHNFEDCKKVRLERWETEE